MSENGNSGDRTRDRMAERFAAMGLDRDPFPESDLHMDFFSRGGRERHLDALADLWGLGRPLVLITGPAGVGRSTCFHALMRRLPDDVRSARVTAGVFLSARNLLQAVARAMGLAVDADESRDEVRDRLYQQIAELGSARTLCAALVDDADELEADALEELISLAELSAETPNVRVLLFGGEGLRRVLHEAVGAERVDPLAHEVRLEPYTLNELRGYLQFRLARAGLSGASPFTEQDYQDIYVASRGLARAANAEARRILLARGGRLSPAQIKVIGAGIAAFVVIGVLIVLLSPQSAGPESVVVRELALPAAPTVELAPPQPSKVSSRGEPAAASGVRDGGWLPLVAESAAEAGDEASPEADEQGPAEPVVSAGAAATERAVEPAAEASPASAPVARTASSTPVEPTAQRARQDTATRGTSMGAMPPDTGSRLSAPASVPPPAAAPDRHALLSRDPSRYVLQVLVLSARDRADTWVQQRPEPSAYEIYRRTRNGATQYVVLQGDYRDRNAASSASESVASATGQRPFLRDMASVQAELVD